MIHYSSWYKKKISIFVTDYQGNKYYFCPWIEVTHRFRDISSGCYFLEVEFQVDGTPETVLLDRKMLVGNFLPELVNRGFSIVKTEINEHTLAEILMEQEQTLPIDLCHAKLGYQTYLGETYYFGQEEISGKLTSKYVGALPMTHEGAFCEWQNFVNDILQTNPILSLPLTMGCSAPVATRLKNAGATDETVLIALIGASSSGKTSSLRLSSSVWGRPSGDGIIDNLTGTEKYFFASLASREGLPGFYDETSATTWDFTKAIYTVALSREGGRCNPDGTPKKRNNWSGAVIFTGETSMFHRTNGNAGLHARLLEFDFPWFSDGETPDKICRFVSHNYGTAWQQFVSYLQTIDDLALLDLFDKAVKEIRKEIALAEGFKEENWKDKKFSGIQNRIIKKLAILLISADAMITAWDFTLDRAKFLEYILAAYDHNASRIDKIDEFCDSFVQTITLNRNAFPEVAGSGFDISAKCSARGFQARNNQKNCVWVLAEEFEKELLKHGLETSRSTLKELNNRGMIEHFGDRYKKAFKTGRISPLCYCFYQDSANISPPNPKNKKNKKKKTSKQLKSLLED